MNDQVQKEKKKIFTLRVKNSVKVSNWKELAELLPGAEEVKIDEKLLLQCYLLLGEYFSKEEPYSDAMVFYSKAISITDDEYSYLKLAGLTKRFCKLYETSFCKFDLQRIQTYLRFLIKKVTLLFPGNYALLGELNSNLNDVKELESSTTNELTESSALIHIDKIFNVFHRPKNPQEVFERSADVMLEWIQPFYDEESEKESESKKKKKKSKKKKKKKMSNHFLCFKTLHTYE